MEVTLYRGEDVKPRYRALALHAMQYRHLTRKARRAVLAAGRGVMRDGGGETHEAINAPKEWRVPQRCVAGLLVSIGVAVVADAVLGYLGVTIAADPKGIVVVDNLAKISAQMTYGLWGMLIGFVVSWRYSG